MNRRLWGGVVWHLLLVLLGSLNVDVCSPRVMLAANALTITPLGERISAMTSLRMGKGFNKARNKQAELAKKMALAKFQNKKEPSDGMNKSNENKNMETTGRGGGGGGGDDGGDTHDERKLRQDFEKLLQSTKGAIPIGDDGGSAYISPIQAGSKLKKKIAPKRKQPSEKEMKVLQEQQREKERQKDKVYRIESQRLHFESLIDVETSAPLGAIGAAKLVPWVPPFVKIGLIVLADPRSNSNDLRKAMKYQHSSHSKLEADGNGVNNNKNEIDVVFITADSVGETNAWLKRNDMDISATSKSKPTGPTSKIRVCSDPRLSFMTSYEIIADDIEHRWSLTMLVFDTNGSILQSERDVDASNCNQLISKAIRDLRKIG
mmetsp:Transcript_27775/g.58220  ORF Transcript_27775/g.58220 Transcript_27775/m.58220 type:complete len:376 (-) Transcript_27775:768-1895(-)